MKGIIDYPHHMLDKVVDQKATETAFKDMALLAKEKGITVIVSPRDEIRHIIKGINQDDAMTDMLLRGLSNMTDEEVLSIRASFRTLTDQLPAIRAGLGP
jgi:hypothetical protein